MATPLQLFLFFVIVIVVADVLTIYSVYNSNVLYKRQRRFYKGSLQKKKYIDSKKKKGIEEIQLLKILPFIRSVKVVQ